MGPRLTAISHQPHGLLFTGRLSIELQLQLNSKSESKSHCYWRLVGRSVSQSVSQSVLVSSPIWGSWPNIYYCLTVTVLLLWGALSDERTGWTELNIFPIYNPSARTTQKTQPILNSSIVALVHFRGNLFTESLPSCEGILWISGFMSKYTTSDSVVSRRGCLLLRNYRTEMMSWVGCRYRRNGCDLF
jgi:hypothetical protein